MKTSEQLGHWKGDFGDAYTQRNQPTVAMLESRIKFFGHILAKAQLPACPKILEVGANVGMNLCAIQRLLPAKLCGVDPNWGALVTLTQDQELKCRTSVCQGEALNLPFRDASFDLVFTRGVLIHIHPDNLIHACSEILRVSRKYILCAEYFASKPEQIEYRGHHNLLFKRDFGGFYLDHWPELQIVDYGFLWKRVDFDDVTWWLFAKSSSQGT